MFNARIGSASGLRARDLVHPTNSETTMPKFARGILLLSAVCAAVFALTGSAFGSRGIGLERVAEGETISGSGSVTFEEGEFFRFRRIICTVTLDARVRVLVLKASADRTEGKIGEITAGRTAGCSDSTGGAAAATVLAEATTNGERHPFPMIYHSFLGTLPEISGVLVNTNNSAFLLEDREAGFTSCLYEGTQGFLFEVARRVTSRGRFLSENRIPLIRASSESCPRNGRLSGSLTFNRTIGIILLP